MTTRTSIRLATEADFDGVVDVVWQAFLDDPVYNYFGSLREVSIIWSNINSTSLLTGFR
jgi:hypothetical protein